MIAIVAATATWIVARTYGGRAARSSALPRPGVVEASVLTGPEPGSQPAVSSTAGVNAAGSPSARRSMAALSSSRAAR